MSATRELLGQSYESIELGACRAAFEDFEGPFHAVL
jgi:hypothetical protein